MKSGKNQLFQAVLVYIASQIVHWTTVPHQRDDIYQHKLIIYGATKNILGLPAEPKIAMQTPLLD